MLSRCANSQCSKPFLRLRQGRLFLVETEFPAKSGELTGPQSPYMRQQPRRIERYWLCDHCAELWTLVHDANQGIVLVALQQRPVAASAQGYAETA